MTVRFGILGSGFMAHTYAECLARHVSGARLAAIACGTRAPGLAATYGVDAEPDAASLLARDDVDAVIVATPHSTHLPLTRLAASAGKHIYMEKPMARDVTECQGMLEACEAAGVLLTVNKVTRFREAPTTAKRLLDEGAIGDLRMIRVTSAVEGYLPDETSWTKDPAEGGAWLDMGAHLCDAIRWFTGSEVVSVYASVGDFVPSAAGDLLRSSVAQLRLASGLSVQILMSFEMPPPGYGSQSQWLFVGSGGFIEADAYGAVRHGNADGWATVFEMPWFDLNADVLSPIRLRAFAAQVQDLTDAIRDDRQPMVTGRDGLIRGRDRPGGARVLADRAGRDRSERWGVSRLARGGRPLSRTLVERPDRLADSEHMAARSRGRLFRVPPPEHLQEHRVWEWLVLFREAVPGQLGLGELVDPDAQWAFEDRPHLLEQREAREVHHGPVEPHICRRDGVDVAVGQRDRELVEGRGEAVEVVVRHGRAGASERTGLDIPTQLVERLDLVLGQGHHDGSPSRERTHEPFLLEEAQRLSHGPAADTEAGSQVGLEQPCAGRDLPVPGWPHGCWRRPRRSGFAV